MVQVLEVIKMRGGAQVELLATPALFAIARRKGMKIEADAKNVAEVYEAYSKLLYLAAINAWEVRRYDKPDMGECPYQLMDFVEWCSEDAERFGKAVNFVLCALTNKDIKDYATGQAESPETAEETEEGEDVKKKLKSGWITRLLRRFL